MAAVHPAHQGPELVVVLLEDLRALLGLTFALFGVTMAVVIATHTTTLLIGEAADPVMAGRIEAALDGAPGVLSVINLRTSHLSPDELLVTAKIEIEETVTARDVAGLTAPLAGRPSATPLVDLAVVAGTQSVAYAYKGGHNCKIDGDAGSRPPGA